MPPGPTALVPRRVPPAVNVTVPVAASAPPVMTTVTVTGSPGIDGFGADDTVRLVAASTVWVRGAETEPPNSGSPWYSATTVWLPPETWLTVQVAVPESRRWAAHPGIGTPLSVNPTVPVASEGPTVAV